MIWPREKISNSRSKLFRVDIVSLSNWLRDPGQKITIRELLKSDLSPQKKDISLWDIRRLLLSWLGESFNTIKPIFGWLSVL